MALPTTRQQLKEHSLRRLGAPVIDINVDDSQLEDRIDDALQFFADYHYDGAEKLYLPHAITTDDITNGYLNLTAIDDSVLSITNVLQFSTLGANMFDVNYQIALNDWYGWRGGGGGGMTNYALIRQNMAMVQQMLDPAKSYRFNRSTMRLYIDMDWSTEVEAGDHLVLEVWATIDPDQFAKVWQDRLLKEYVTALFKRQWGANLSKFQDIQLPGGVSFNGQQIFDQAHEQVQKIEEEMQLKYEEPPGFIVG
jgi:hypothetical protein|tara:strand:- start:1965 stop:2720 length:756 start_codon:yes stop_codon:yes gene_type:complete